MRDQRLTSLRNGVLTALGLLGACGGQVDGQGIEPDEAAAPLRPGATPGGAEGEAALCDAMLASTAPAESCWLTPRYAWDGARCAALYCSCAGADCGSAYSSVMGCYDERGGCDPLASERAACIERYPSQGDAAGAQASSECLANAGAACDAASFISEAAAVCIAELEGLEEGVVPWVVSLSYHSGHGRVVRNVTSTTSVPSNDGAAGWSLTLDASTGVVLDESGWLAIPGRPFLVDRAPRTAEAMRRADYSASTGVRLDDIPAELRAALASEWTRIGLLEHASVAAFARFALQLLGLGAPPDLVEACQQAMQDELRHTRIAFGLASAYAGAPLGPGALKLDGALDDSIDDLLAEVAIGTLVEGCIGETIAALDAREGAACAADPHVRQALSEIAADEERHAELAWRFLDWALTQRPVLATQLLARARAQLSRAPSRLTSGTERGAADTAAALLEHGILPREQKLELEAQALEHVIVPCLAALASKHASAAPGADRQPYLA